MTDVESKVLARIKKILAIATNEAATEQERDTAMTMAHNLLAKYNLSMTDVPGAAGSEPREEQRTTISADKWARSLCSAIADLYFCKYLYSPAGCAGKDNHFFIGKQSNSITALHMSEYLIKSIKRESTKRYRSPTSPDGRSFCVGAVRAISRRVSALVAESCDAEPQAPSAAPAEPSAPGTALALATVYKTESEANLAWVAQHIGETRETKSRKDTSLRSDAFYEGRAHGASVSLNTQLKG